MKEGVKHCLILKFLLKYPLCTVGIIRSSEAFLNLSAERIEIRCFSLYDIMKSSDIFFTHSSICYTGFTRDKENKKILCLHNSEPTSKEKGKRAEIFVKHSGLEREKSVLQVQTKYIQIIILTSNSGLLKKIIIKIVTTETQQTVEELRMAYIHCYV